MLTTGRPLRTILIGTLAAILAVGGMAAFVGPASAAGCAVDQGTGWGQVACPGGGGGGGGDPENVGNGGGGGGGPRVCSLAGVEVPCTSDQGTWNGNSYCMVEDPQPPQSHPAWQGHTDGVIVKCTFGAGAAGGGVILKWAPGPPDAPTPSPRQIAQEIVVTMHLSTGRVGTTPPPTQTKADSKGVIGLPIWLWIDQRGENTTGPMTRSNSGYGTTVTATATLARVEWTMRSAGAHSGAPVVATVTCKGKNAAGTAFAESMLPADGSAIPSPTCGFPASQNTTPGTYTISATAYWSVAWNGAGESGTFEVPTTGQSGTVTFTEMQALVDH